ncbi:MAG: ribonuclease domain-containing protein [Oscillospiraceae bacterium]|nr:ribonuclease domain-containing protein [Oscillospiraceae bacterium]
MKRFFSVLSVLICMLLFTGCFNSADKEEGFIETDKETDSLIADMIESVTVFEETGSEETEVSEIISISEETEPEETTVPDETEEVLQVDENGAYTTKQEVAFYIYTYGHLPSNFITKKEAESLGWSGGSLEPYAPGKCIGGNRFGNYEGLLPEKDGRKYTECDIDTLGAEKRGAKRIVFSNDGLIYYTEDHYETFELLYGSEE